MAELSSSKPAAVAHVSPIWPKRKRRKSFEKVAKTLSKVLRFIQEARNSSIHAVSERLKDFDTEHRKKEERLEKVKSVAKIKTDGADERKHNGWLMYREKLRYLRYLERMTAASTNYSNKKLMRSASNIGQLKHFNTREKSFQSTFWMKSLKTEQKINELKPKAESSNGLFNAVNLRSRHKDLVPTKRRPDQLNASPSAGTSKLTELTSQPSSLDAKLDPRFQNLLSSLTPIDC